MEEDMIYQNFGLINYQNQNQNHYCNIFEIIRFFVAVIVDNSYFYKYQKNIEIISL